MNLDELKHAYQKGTITAEEAMVKVADYLTVPVAVIQPEHIGALENLRVLGGLVDEACGPEVVAWLDQLRSKLILARDNKLVLAGKFRVIQIEREDTFNPYSGMTEEEKKQAHAAQVRQMMNDGA